MSYALGVDVGTTFSAAAVCRNDHVEMIPLGGTGDVIPSVVLVREDGTVLVGEAAVRRGATEPHRLAREFKRRFGQPEPILLGGAPYSPEALTAHLLKSIVETVATREGSRPDRICLSHPANWGPFKRDLFEHVVRLADITEPVVFTTEAEAAAVAYARAERVEPGSVVAVYDLGGGTFDAAVLRKNAAGFEILGQPEGIEQLGGIDVDAAVFHHVSEALGDRLADLDEDDPAAISAVARLRRDCVEAKEALSADTDTSIPVLLPDHSTHVRLTRAELEGMVRPMLAGTLDALRRALTSAKVTPDELTSVLLVGGGSRMPIVAQLVGSELGRPVAVDAHPKHAIATGAAWLAAEPVGGTAPVVLVPPPVEAPTRPADTAFETSAEEWSQTPLFAPVDERRTSRRDDAAPARGERDETDDYDEYDEQLAAPRAADRRGRRRGPVLVAALVALLVIAGGGAYAVQALRSPAKHPTSATTTSKTTKDPARVELDALVKQDRAEVEKDLLDQWAPQLTALQNGVATKDGKTYSYAGILARHQQMVARFPGALLVDTDDWPKSFRLPDAYATMIHKVFDTPQEALAWCQDHDFGRDECFAKRVSRSGTLDGNILKASTSSSSGSSGGTGSGATPTPTPSATPTDTSEPTPTATPTGTE